MKISLHTLGCKLNQAETDELRNTLQKMGHFIVPIESGENVAIVRGCAVTIGASQSTREMIRRLKRTGAFVIAIGCLENRTLPEIDFLAESNEQVINKIEIMRTEIMADNIHHSDNNDPINRTRAFIKIQSGCNFNCAYCIIPSFRGKNVSIPANVVVRNILKAEKNNFKEVVLTGVNICQYQTDINLAGLLKKILVETNLPRIRLGSLDPRLISDELIEIFSKNQMRLMPHWHLSLQSGSDKILKLMNRHYTAEKYLAIVNKLRSDNPTFSFTTDIIVAFPGETEADFALTCDLIKKVQFSRVHVFPYSKRPGTPAAEDKNQIPDKVKSARVKQLTELAEMSTREYLKKLDGAVRPVLFENKKSAEAQMWEGYTPEYIRVVKRSQKNLYNTIVKITL